MNEEVLVGGQAVIEGVMMLSPKKYAVAVRAKDNSIVYQSFELKKSKSALSKVLLIRGLFRFADMIVIGLKALSYSANASLDEEEKLSNRDLVFTILFSLAINIALFIGLPLLITSLIADKSEILTYNLIDGAIRLILFILFLLSISLFPDIRRLFQYHGAEHMTVHCYEAKEKLTVKNVRKYSTIHPRCGTTFLLIVFALSVFFFSFIPTTSWYVRLLLRLLMVPVIAGISYEILRFTAKNKGNAIVKIIMKPGLLMQKLTTRVPENHQLEVAIVALKQSLN